MADSLYDVLIKAINVYLDQPDRYYKMILKGFEKAGHFSWGVNAKRYYQVYNMIKS